MCFPFPPCSGTVAHSFFPPQLLVKAVRISKLACAHEAAGKAEKQRTTEIVQCAPAELRTPIEAITVVWFFINRGVRLNRALPGQPRREPASIGLMTIIKGIPVTCVYPSWCDVCAEFVWVQSRAGHAGGPLYLRRAPGRQEALSRILRPGPTFA